jgi:hypothetical protein
VSTRSWITRLARARPRSSATSSAVAREASVMRRPSRVELALRFGDTSHVEGPQVPIGELNARARARARA